MTNTISLLVGGSGGRQVHLGARMANRHGMIAGATGTGKTVSLQVLAEGFSRLGVPVFLADVKGDLSGLALSATPNARIDERLAAIGIETYQPEATPVVFWDVYGKQGHPIRTTVSELGPLLFSSLLGLNETQTGLLYAAFRIADEHGMLMLDLKDLRAMLAWMASHAKELRGEYGNISAASVGAIQRRLLVLEEQDAERFLGEPAVELNDLIGTDASGRGVVNIMDVTRLMRESPRLYATFLLWLLSELFEQLPEVGDPDQPVFVMFFDEAHLLFDDAPKALLKKVEQVVRLIRSKGVGVYFVTQSPLDIPEEVLGQLGLRIQHALRAFTPKDRKAVRTVAQTFRQNPDIDTETAITELGIGEALVSVLDDDGSPTPVERVLVRPPRSRIGPLTAAERARHLDRSPMRGRYDDPVDRDSAYELLKQRTADQTRRAELEALREQLEREERARRRQMESAREALTKNLARSLGTQLGRYGGQILRGVLGSFGGSRR